MERADPRGHVGGIALSDRPNISPRRMTKDMLARRFVRLEVILPILSAGERTPEMRRFCRIGIADDDGDVLIS